MLSFNFVKKKMSSFRKGANVWVEDKQLAWVPAEVVDFVNNQVQLVTSSGNKVFFDFFFLKFEF